MALTRPTSKQLQGHFGAIRASKTHTIDQKIDIAAGNYASGKVFPGITGASDPSWIGATNVFLVYFDDQNNLILNDTSSTFPILCTKIAKIVISSGIIVDIIDERAEVNGLTDAYQVAFDDYDMNIATPADDVQEAITLLDAYVWDIQSAMGQDLVKYVDLDVGGGIKNGLVRNTHLDDAPAVEFPKRPEGIGRVRYSASIPQDWVEGTNITIKIFWSPSDAFVGDVKWRLSYRLAASGNDMGAAMSTTSFTQSTPGVINRLLDTGDNLQISAASIQSNRILIVNIEREYSGDDTYNSTARVHLARMEYTGRGIE